MAKRKVKVKKIGKILLLVVMVICAGVIYLFANNFSFFSDNISVKYLTMLKLISLIVLFLGCVLSSTAIWTFVDIFTALLAIINIYTLFKLKNDVLYELGHYNKKKL